MELAARHHVPTRLISMCEQEHLEVLSKGWGVHERVIHLTLQEQRAQVELRTSRSGEEQTPSWMPQRVETDSRCKLRLRRDRMKQNAVVHSRDGLWT